VTWLLAAAGFALLIILHEAGHFAAAKAVGMRVERFALFFPPMLFTVRRGETEYGVGSIPLGGYVRITGMNPREPLDPEVAPRAYLRQPVWKRIVVIAAGPAVNLVLAFLLIWALLAVVGLPQPTDTVQQLTPRSPAAGVLRPGDRIVAVDGVRGDFDALRGQIDRHRCAGPQRPGCRAAEPARLLVARGDERLTLAVRPRYDAEARQMLVGFRPATRQVTTPPGRAAGQTLDVMWQVTSLTVSKIVQIFDAQERKDLSGVVGSFEVTRQAIQIGAGETLWRLGLISLSLGVINLFPFLPLDGGHIVWALAEKLRGRAIPYGLVERFSLVGVLLVVLLFVVGLSNDIERLANGGFDLPR
jgi:regulator of sigma E protease